MSAIAEIWLWGSRIGVVSLEDRASFASFQYVPEFIRSGIELSPIMMKLSDQVYRFPALNIDTFHGLPGLLADSLPDSYGNALIDAWLVEEGRLPEEFNAVERLCYTGKRGMGALEFRPAKGPRNTTAKKIAIERLVKLASDIMGQREDLSVSFSGKNKTDALKEILLVGTSAGGARAKAVISWNPQTNEVRSGQIDAGDGFEYWLLKFDGVGKEISAMNNPSGYGAIEYAYHKMAEASGIIMMECRLFEENNRRHFMTRRYDRDAKGGKLHKLSLGGMGHLDFSKSGANSYEQAFFLMRKLGLPVSDTEQLFRRMVFNIVTRNQDDHVKNIEFLMNREGKWSLAPAFDMTYSYNPKGVFAGAHQMALNGKVDGFSLSDFTECAGKIFLKRGRAESILKEITEVVVNWEAFAEEAGVTPLQREKIRNTLRLNLI